MDSQKALASSRDSFKKTFITIIYALSTLYDLFHPLAAHRANSNYALKKFTR